MKKQSIERVGRSSVVWENLEAWVRGRIQGYLQDLLEEEVTVFFRAREIGASRSPELITHFLTEAPKIVSDSLIGSD